MCTPHHYNYDDFLSRSGRSTLKQMGQVSLS